MEKFWIDHRIDSAGYRLEKHYEHCYQLLFLLNGKIRYVVGEKEYLLNRGNIIALNTLEEHSLEVLEYPYERILVQIDPSWFQHEIKKPELISIFAQRAENFSHLLALKESCWIQIYEMLQEMITEFKMQSEYWEMMVSGDLRRIFVTLKRECPEHFLIATKGPSAKIAYKALHYLDQHFTENLNVNQIADALFFSRHYISHAFQDEFGYSMMDYVIMLRINRAKALLSQKNMGITEVALECGYEDFAYFSRIFKKRTGMTPTAFRKSCASSEEDTD